jgi:hypothetical protein
MLFLYINPGYLIIMFLVIYSVLSLLVYEYTYPSKFTNVVYEKSYEVRLAEFQTHTNSIWYPLRVAGLTMAIIFFSAFIF